MLNVRYIFESFLACFLPHEAGMLIWSLELVHGGIYLLMMLSKNMHLQLNSRELTHVINHLHMFGSHYRGERACAVRKIEWKLPDVHIIYLTLLSNLSCLFRYVSKLSTRTTFPSLTTQASFATVCTKNWSCDTQITAPLKFLTLSASVATLSKSKLVLV